MIQLLVQWVKTEKPKTAGNIDNNIDDKTDIDNNNNNNNNQMEAQ